MTGLNDWDAADDAISSAWGRIEPPRQVRQRVRARLREVAASSLDESPDEATVASKSVVRGDEVVTLSDSSQHDTGSPQPGRLRLNRRQLIGVTTAAAAGGLALWLFRPRPISAEQLVDPCRMVLDELYRQPPQWQRGSGESIQRLEPLQREMRELPQAVGFHPVAAERFAERGVVWKFILANGKGLYVIDWQDAQPVSGLHESIRVIAQSSGSWSLAAMQRPSQVLVAAVEGEIAPLLRAAPLA